MKHLFKISRISLLFLVIFSVVLTNTTSVLAQTSPDPSDNSYTCGSNPTDPQCNASSDYQQALQDPKPNLVQYSSQFMLWVMTGINTALTGTGASPGNAGATGTPYNHRDVGAIGFISGSILQTFKSRDISGVQYLASLNPITPANAAGNEVLFPILNMWKTFRNIAYILLVVALIAFGFMIMFRYNLDPRTVITISDALPRVVIALILITFSYAIVGLFIDASKVLEGVVTNALSPLQRDIATCDAPGNPCKDTHDKFRYSGGPQNGQTRYPVNFQLSDILTFEGFFEGIGPIFSTSGNPFQVGTWVNALAGGVAQMVMNFMLFSLLIQLLFGLIRYLAGFFLLAIFGPLAILWSVLPGQEDTLKTWFSQLLTATLVFPAVFLMLNVAFYFYIWGRSATYGRDYFANPSFLDSLPALVRQNGQNLVSFIILGILLVTSKIPAVIEEALKATPSKSAHAGVDLRGVAKKLPIIGGFA